SFSFSSKMRLHCVGCAGSLLIFGVEFRPSSPPKRRLFLALEVFENVFGIHALRHELGALVPELPKYSLSTPINESHVTQIDHIPAAARPVAHLIPIRAKFRYPRA